jgi:two-component system sensor histidine kinase FlrB
MRDTYAALIHRTVSADSLRTFCHMTPSDTAPPLAAMEIPTDPARLAEAFRLFNQVSEELSTAYGALERQVEALTDELAAANGALRQQYQEKAALTERLTRLLEALPAGVAVLDREGRLDVANPAADHLLGTPALGMAWAEIEQARLHPTETSGEMQAGEHRVAVTMTAPDAGGGRIVLLHDITEAHRLKMQSERNERLAAMGEMAAQLAHQLRTPLAAALLYAGNLENPDLPEASRLSIAQKTVGRLKHLERLIQDMLLFARGEVLGREAFAVEELLNELRHIFEPLARARGVEFVLASAPAGLEITGNRKALAGALTNLLENALHAATGVEGGRISLGVDVAEDRLAFTVKDNGRGMPPDVGARLFEPFYPPRPEGTGLGLAIARGVARAHGGGIDVESAPGVGTEFVLTVNRGTQAIAMNNSHEESA